LCISYVGRRQQSGPPSCPATAALLGGIVSLGSNVSTLRQTMEAIAAAEARRSQLIDGIDLRLVGGQRG
jgi:hypothetical protein